MTVVAVVGLGYVGLPLAVEFGKTFDTIGYDLSASKIGAYKRGEDPNGEISKDEFHAASKLVVTAGPEALRRADFLVIAVPTPVDEAHRPDLRSLLSASETVGKYMKRGCTVVFESTVYPGATAEVCVPAIERASGMKWRKDFHVGYSPERINPSDREHTLTRIVKLVSGDDPETTERVAEIYGAIIKAGVHPVSSIMVAEAAKVIENTQRDLNIALVNELAIIFRRLNIDTMEVLRAAGTKWNFLPFRPGLVGGHCIGVDPYYLTHKAETVGYHPEVILAGRRINDGMGKYVAEQTVKEMINAGFNIKNAKVNVLGLTFKENCRDIRNSRVIDVIAELRSYGVDVAVHDPVCSAEDALNEYRIELRSWDELPRAHAAILAVSHRQFFQLTARDLAGKLVSGGCLADVKSVLPVQELMAAGLRVWRL